MILVSYETWSQRQQNYRCMFKIEVHSIGYQSNKIIYFAERLELSLNSFDAPWKLIAFTTASRSSGSEGYHLEPEPSSCRVPNADQEKGLCAKVLCEHVHCLPSFLRVVWALISQATSGDSAWLISGLYLCLAMNFFCMTSRFFQHSLPPYIPEAKQDPSLFFHSLNSLG